MELPFDPKRRDIAIALVRDRLGNLLSTQPAQLTDDELEELVFRIACGEY